MPCAVRLLSAAQSPPEHRGQPDSVVRSFPGLFEGAGVARRVFTGLYPCVVHLAGGRRFSVGFVLSPRRRALNYVLDFPFAASSPDLYLDGGELTRSGRGFKGFVANRIAPITPPTSCLPSPAMSLSCRASAEFYQDETGTFRSPRPER